MEPTKVSVLGDGHLIGVVPSFCTLHGFSQNTSMKVQLHGLGDSE